MKKMLALLLALMMVLSLVACGAPDDGAAQDVQENTVAADDGQSVQADDNDSGEYYVIGCAQPLSGPNALFGEAAYNAAALAVEKLNAAGGLNGVPIKLISYDDQGSTEEAVKIANKMIDVDKVDAVIESIISSNVLAAGQYLNDAGIVMLGTGTSPTWMSEDWPYVFRACLNTDYVMPNLADMMQQMDLSSAAIFQGQDDAGKAAGEGFAAACEAVGITITTVESYAQGDTDFSGQIAKIISSEPDCVFMALLGADQPVFLKQLRQFGYEGIVLNKESIQLDTIQIAGDAANYVAFAYPYLTYDSPADCDDPEMKEFLEMYEKAYGATPTTDCAYRAYDSVMILAEGANIAGSNDSDAIVAAINTISGFEGLGGTFDYTAGDREGLHAFNKFIVIDGVNVSYDTWLAEGGYEALKEEIS